MDGSVLKGSKLPPGLRAQSSVNNTQKLGTAVHTCDLSTEAEAGGSELKVSLGYLVCLKPA